MEILYTLLGATMIYAWVHFIIITFKKKFDERTDYEVFITFYAIVMFVLFVIGSAM